MDEPQAGREGQITCNIAQVQKSLSSLIERIDQLETALVPILKEPGLLKEADSKPDQALVPVAAELRSIGMIIDSGEVRLNDILSRLEL